MNKKINPAKKLANSITSGLRPSFCVASKAIATNPSIPIIPLTTRMNDEILFFLLRFSCLGDEGPLRLSSRDYSPGAATVASRPEAEVGD